MRGAPARVLSAAAPRASRPPTCSPVNNDGAFMKKFGPIFNSLTKLGADDSDEVAVTTAASQVDLMADLFNIIGAANYYNYAGSLTTPGCNEGINWFLMANPMYLSTAQVLDFTSVLAQEQNGAVGMSRGADNRLVQPLNGRSVYASFK
jgi:carbonic anhydrase